MLAIDGVTKRFGSTVALDDVSLDVMAGEIHALIGENGSGKSTLCNVLFGDPVIARTGGYEGRIVLDGKQLDLASPEEALAHGIGLVHQELSLIAAMSVAENVVLGREPVRGKLPLAPVDDSLSREAAIRALRRIGVDIDPSDIVGDLPIGMRQLVEAAREFDRSGMKVLILDEPSAALSAVEADALARMMRALADSGVAVLLVTHRLPEVIAVADRVTVLRDGKVVATLPTASSDAEGLARLMLGADASTPMRRECSALGETALRVDGLRVAMPGDPLRALSFDVRRGEIVGVTAQAGHGRLAIASGLLGLYPAIGDLEICGKRQAVGDPIAMEQAGLSVVHEDRRRVGLNQRESIALNIALPSLVAGRRFVRAPWFPGGGFPDATEMRAAAEELATRFDIRCESVDQRVGELSGGNQQKVAIARAVLSQPSAIVVAEPTRGIDVGAKGVVLEALASIAAEGVAVVIVSGEVAELERVCDRIIVLRDGRIAEEFRAPIDVVAVELAMLAETETREVS